MNNKPTILDKKIVARSRLFAVEELKLRFSNGVERVYERLRTPPTPAVMIVPVLDDQILFIREYAAGFHEYQLTLPKGAVDPGETILEAADRELMEEAGYGAGRLTPLKELTLAPGHMGHRIEAVLAQDLYPKSLPGDEPEPLEVVPWPIARLEELMLSEELKEARVIAALYLAQKQLTTSNPSPSKTNTFSSLG